METGWLLSFGGYSIDDSLIGKREILHGLFMGVATILGSWAGKKVIERLSRDRFILLVEVLLIISRVQLE